MTAKLYRAAPTLYALGIFILFEIVYVRPTWIFQIVAVAALLTAAAVLKICPAPKFRKDNFLKTIIPVALICAGVGFAYLLESAALRHVLALLIAVVGALFLKGLQGTLPMPRTEAYGRFENFSGYAITFTIFFLASVLFGLRILLSLRFWIVGLIFLAILAILNYTMLWLSQGERPAPISAEQKPQSGRRSVLLFSGVLTIATFELFLVFAFLPVYFMVSGAALTIFWYTVMLISRAKLLGLLNRRMVYRHITLGAVLLAGLLLTSRWE